MTTVLVTQPVYLPPTWWVARALQADVVILLDGAQFTRKHRGAGGTGPTWQNMAEILLDGNRHRLTIPTAANRTPIRDTPLAADGWRARHLATIRQAYSRAPYFDRYFLELDDELPGCPDCPDPHLGDVTVGTSLWALNTIHGGRGPKVATDQACDVGDLHGTEWMIALARSVGADRYLVGQTALANYLDVNQFEQAGIELVPHRYRPRPYPQLQGDFEPNLSIVDLLMNVDPHDVVDLLVGI